MARLEIPRRGLMLVLSSPSGAGKTTIGDFLKQSPVCGAAPSLLANLFVMNDQSAAAASQIGNRVSRDVGVPQVDAQEFWHGH